MSRIFCNLFKTLNISLSQINNKSIAKILPISGIINQRFKSIEPRLTPQEIVDPKWESTESTKIIDAVKNEIVQGKQGRLFAVVHLAGKQFKITHGDIIVVEGYWPPDVGDKISLDKVLLLGAKDFTLIGRPIIERGLVNVEATVIEKCLSHTKTHFRKKRRKQYKRINFYRIQQTHLRINCVEINGELNNPPEITGLEHVVL